MRILFRILDELFYWNDERLPGLLAALRSFAWQRSCGPEPKIEECTD